MSIFFPERIARKIPGDLVRKLYALLVWYPASWLSYGLDRKLFHNVDTYVSFLGYPRSGSTLVAALLNAHPRMLIAQELNASRYILLGFRRQQIFALLRLRDTWFHAVGGLWNGYDYTIPGSAQAYHGDLKVVGDRKVGGLTWDLYRHPDLLQLIKRRMGMPLRVIHNVRNPYDMIATMAVKDGRTTAQGVARFVRMANTVQEALRTLEADEVLHQWHEDFVADSPGHMKALCEFLGLEADLAYLEACNSIVFASPKRSRDAVTWTQEDVDKVEALCQEIDFLHRYSGSGATIQLS